MSISNQHVPDGAKDIASYKGERISTVSVWFFDVVNKRMMAARSTNIESYLLRAQRFVVLGKDERLGERMKMFLRSIAKHNLPVFWLPSTFGLEKGFKDAGWLVHERFSASAEFPTKKVMISGKVLRIEHLKSHFVFYSAVEPKDLKATMVARLARALNSLPTHQWRKKDEVICFFERFAKGFNESKPPRSEFKTQIVSIPHTGSQIAYARIQNNEETIAWLERKGFERKCSPPNPTERDQ